MREKENGRKDNGMKKQKLEKQTDEAGQRGKHANERIWKEIDMRAIIIGTGLKERKRERK